MKALTISELKERIFNKYNGEYTLLSSGKILSRTKIQIKHKCGNIINTTFQSFLNDNCNVCRKCIPVCHPIKQNTALTLDIVKERIRNNGFAYIDGFINVNSKMQIKHLMCGTSFSMFPKDLFRRKSGCPTCANNIRGKYALKENYLKTLLNESPYNDKQEYEWQEEYRGSNKIPHSIKHLICGNIYKVRPNDFQQGYRCSECNSVLPSESKDHKLIQTILEEYNIPFSKEFTDVRCKFKNVLRFDFAIPLKDKILLIEYDGIQHFKQTALFSHTQVADLQLRDNIKNEFAQKYSSEYSLERIFYKDDVIDKMEEIFLKYALPS